MTVLDPKARKTVEEKMDEIVELAEKCIDETNIAASGMEESQLRNLQNMANATDSVKALENFVCYQMGRNKEWRDTGFGNHVLKDFETLCKKAEKIAADTSQIRAVHIELIRLYLGFLVRTFIAKRPRK